MKKLFKVLAALLIVFVLLVVGAVVAAGYFINDIAKKGIEQGGTHALGVETKLDKASVGLFSGKFGMNGLSVANPPGFAAPAFLTLGEGGVAVDYSTLQQPTVELPELRLIDIGVSLQKKDGKANYKVILDNLKKLQGEPGGKPAEPSAGGDEKRFIVRQLTIRNVRVDVDLLDAPAGLGEMAKISIPIETIELSNVGQTGTGVKGTGVTMEQLASIIVQAVLAAAAENGGGKLPVDLLNDLQGQLASLGDLEGLKMKAIGDASKALQDATKDATGKLKDAANEAGKKLEEGLKGLGGGLLPGGKKDDKK